MDFLQKLFGDKSLSFDDFKKAVEENKDIKLANLSEGGYVAKEKFDTKEAELKNANSQLTEANKQIASFKDMDVDGMKAAVDDWKTKYEDADKSHKEEMGKIAYNSAAEKFIDTLKPKDNLSRSAIMAEFAKKEFKFDNENFQGATEWADQFKKDNATHFLDVEDSKATKVSTGGSHGNPLDGDVDKFVAAAMSGAGITPEK